MTIRRYLVAPPAGGGGGGAVDSVNGQTGVVDLDAADVGATRVLVDGDYVEEFEVDSTPVTATSLGAIPLSTINAKGDLLAGTADDSLARVAAGTNGQVLTADSSQAAGVKWAPAAAAAPSVGASLQGFRAWSFDSVAAGGTAAVGAASLNVVRMVCETAGTIANLHLPVITTAATGPTAGGCAMAVFDVNGTQIGITGDIGSSLTSVGFKTFAVTSPPTVAAGQMIYVGLLWNGTTGPTIYRSGSTMPTAAGAGAVAANGRFGSLSGQASMPSSINPATLIQPAGTYWFAAS